MKRFFKNIFIFSIFVVSFFLIIVVYNVVLDPFGVIRGDMDKQVTEPNQHYLKIKYLLKNPNKYNAFLFGNSRVGKINVSNIDDKKWYNMSYSEGIPDEYLKDIVLLLKSGIDIKKVIISVDEVTCFVSPDKHKNESLRKPYKNKLNPLVGYLLLKPTSEMYKHIKEAPKKKFFSYGVYNAIYRNGYFPPNLKDDYIDNNKLAFSQDTIFDVPFWDTTYSDNINSAIASLKQIKNICNEHNIEFVIFVNPIYAETYKKALSHGFLSFIEQLSMFTDFYDFSGINEITENKVNFYENSHYRPLIGDFIIKELNSTTSKFLVKKENSSNWIQAKEKEARMHNIVYDRPGF